MLGDDDDDENMEDENEQSCRQNETKRTNGSRCSLSVVRPPLISNLASLPLTCSTMSAAAATQRTTVLSTYRILSRLVRCMPKSKQGPALQELREGYRKNLSAPQDQVDELINEAGKKIAYLRIITPKREWTGSAAQRSEDGTTRWVYSSDGKSADGKGTVRKSGQVHSNWDGSNLDPCSVKRHNQQLKRAGFVNNLHAKGLF